MNSTQSPDVITAAEKRAYADAARTYLQEKQYDKAGEAIEPYVRVRLYEDDAVTKILAYRPVGKDQLHPEADRPNDDSVWVMGKLEQNSEVALGGAFQGRPAERYIGGPRYKIPIGQNETPQATKHEKELWAYDYDILQDAADKDVNELKNARDYQFLTLLNQAIDVQAELGTPKVEPDKIDVGNEGAITLTKEHFTLIQHRLNVGGRTATPNRDVLSCRRLWFSDAIKVDMALFKNDDLGDSLTTEMFTDGTTITRILGVEFMSSLKQWMLTEHEDVLYLKLDPWTTAGSTDFTVNGTTLSITGAGGDDAAATAAKVRDAIEADATVNAEVAVELSGDTLILIPKNIVGNDETQRFEGARPTFGKGNDLAGEYANARFSYDIIWAFPAPQFLGEFIHVNGEEVNSEMWKTPGKQQVNRISRETLGMSIGNVWGVAKQRMQRSRPVPTANEYAAL